MPFEDDKMVNMNAIAEIDKAGRLVVPKKMRVALHLVPGTRLTLLQEGQTIVLQTEIKPRGLYKKRGMWVYETGRPVPPEAVNWVNDDREERSEHFMKDWSRE